MAESSKGRPAQVAANLLREADRLRPFLRQQAPAVEDARRLTPEVHAALVKAGFYRMTMPPQVGAPELPLPEIMRVLESLAWGDGSTAWSVWSALANPMLAAYLPEASAAELFSPPDACLVGSVAARGKAVAVEGGYRVSGRWPFVSNIHHATHACGICHIFDGDTLRLGPDKMPFAVFPIWPVDACEIIDTWDTTGLRGTGSDEVEVADLFVPDRLVIDFSRSPREGLARIHYNFHIDNNTNVAAAAIAVGIADAALEAFRDLGPRKTLATGERLADSALGKMTLAQAETTLAQARGHLYETAELMWKEVEEWRMPDPREWLPRTSLASVAAVDASIEVATRVYREAGSNAIYRSELLDRCLRDLLTLGAHKSVQHINLVLHGGRTFTIPQT
jgi:alkylation response protein AidB-like acyl-CoA dehydrogenase